jgi:hypothetical protein
VAQSVNPSRFPHDPRLGRPRVELTADGLDRQPTTAPTSGTTTFREINGQKLLALRSPDGTRLSLFRIQAHSAMPSLIIEASEKPSDGTPAPPGQPAPGPWLWRDSNGNGQFDPGERTPAPAFRGARFQPTPIDAAGGLWLTRLSDQPRLCHWPPQGTDDQGIPLYPADPAASTPHQPFDSLHDPASDSLFVVAPAGGSNAAAAASQLRLAAHDSWSRRPTHDAALATPRWSHPLPPAFSPENQPSLALAGRLIFLLDPRSSEIHVVEKDTGTSLGHLAPPATKPALPSQPASPAIRAHRRRDGSYLVITQDPAAPRAFVYHLDDPRPPYPAK